MIEYPTRLLVEHVLNPQNTPERGDNRAALSLDEVALDVTAQQLDLLGVTTVPLAEEIGGGLMLRHSLSVLVKVQHGDRDRGRVIRNGIVTDLVLRFRAKYPTMVNDVDTITGQSLAGRSWSIDWRPRGSASYENALIAFTLDADLPR